VHEPLRTRLQTDLLAAMKRRETATVAPLRIALAAIANAEAVDAAGLPSAERGSSEVARRHLTEDDVHGIVAAERDDARSTAATLRVHGRDAEADALDAHAGLLGRYLAPS
jgi:uncharacterized protein YqeY